MTFKYCNNLIITVSLCVNAI